MLELGLIGTVAAWLNYRKAKSEYDALKEKQDGLIAAVQTYNQKKYDKLTESVRIDPDDFMPDVQVSTIVRVGNLVGKFFRVQTSVVLSNTGEDTYYIGSVAADCRILGYRVIVYKMTLPNGEKVPQEKKVDAYLAPGETLEIKLPHGISALYGTDGKKKMDELRDFICKAAGKKLITSCQKISIENGEEADILIKWRKQDAPENDILVEKLSERPGVLRYMMEAYYPND